MDIKDLRNLLKMVTNTDITEFEWEQGEERIVIKRGQVAGGMQAAAPSMVMSAAAVPVAPAPGAAVAVTPAPAAEEEEGFETIESPIVGTFYRAPSPDSDPYVEVGSVIEKGQTLCIVEAMKLMNEIESEFKCRIVKILKENAQPVEYGEPLFLVEPL
ncbi:MULTISPECIES: acetyl-CoA carboxylase biotin carboxyl carrier protein [Syntrophotalea]|jgi:acetyl-CoA carboxylase biotin carboxyl carrier protein|uniref:Biotin carboxyl carrier protein of acetyl-CoA carboxylase n=1 Tax=Syntrophotalea acetylenica TaxID=29542 RepID=A0A1L3GHJ9_SYNAC|nr:acetyl-CoA carboxylase biotin carboxyl carrier protein [Syntrophotalea acetylenica]APG25414.1 acetyl-CoA carboxylase, biotin carboxyl carrier protein [Syntrophotalea acetylenica]APG43482.1 acetyl-CoA carboxylase, biotin carboxyl carrier protein [Syntrophotalea acetylenica]MDY0262706.1 acetyl-CoA carboxylase biotin carboxyl carrier protein [Syntrophotalea acetylenica]